MKYFKVAVSFLFVFTFYSFAFSKGTSALEKKKEKKSYTLSAGYSVNFNALEQKEEKTFFHRVAFSSRFKHKNNWSSGLSLSASYKTHNEKVVRSRDNESFFKISDLSFSVGKSVKALEKDILTNSSSFYISLPFSESSQLERVYLTTGFSNSTSLSVRKYLSLFYRLSTSYMFNSYKYSVSESGTINRDLTVSNSAGVSFSFLKYFGASFSYNYSMLKYLDGSWTSSYGNTASLSAGYKGFSAFVSYYNGSYPDDEYFYFGHYDQFKQNISMGLSYAY